MGCDRPGRLPVLGGVLSVSVMAWPWQPTTVGAMADVTIYHNPN